MATATAVIQMIHPVRDQSLLTMDAVNLAVMVVVAIHLPV